MADAHMHLLMAANNILRKTYFAALNTTGRQLPNLATSSNSFLHTLCFARIGAEAPGIKKNWSESFFASNQQMAVEASCFVPNIAPQLPSLPDKKILSVHCRLKTIRQSEKMAGVHLARCLQDPANHRPHRKIRTLRSKNISRSKNILPNTHTFVLKDPGTPWTRLLHQSGAKTWAPSGALCAAAGPSQRLRRQKLVDIPLFSVQKNGTALSHVSPKTYNAQHAPQKKINPRICVDFRLLPPETRPLASFDVVGGIPSISRSSWQFWRFSLSNFR